MKGGKERGMEGEMEGGMEGGWSVIYVEEYGEYEEEKTKKKGNQEETMFGENERDVGMRGMH